MKKLPNGKFLFDSLDIICISFLSGIFIGKLYQQYKNYQMKETKVDPIVDELKKSSPINLPDKNKSIKLPLIRGGDDIGIDIGNGNGNGIDNGIGKIPNLFYLTLKNEKIAKIFRAINNARTSQKKLRFLRQTLLILNLLLRKNLGLCIGVGESRNFVQIILLVIPSSIAGFLWQVMNLCPNATTVLLIMVFLNNLNLEEFEDPYERCRLLCKVAEEFHNKQMKLEMRNLIKSLVEDNEIKFPINEGPFRCVENKYSLLERFQLRQVYGSKNKNIQYFSEFIKKFSECNGDLEDVFEEALENLENKKRIF